MSLKSPTDRFLKEFIVCLFTEAYNYEGYLQTPATWWVRDRIDDIDWSLEDKERAHKLVE